MHDRTNRALRRVLPVFLILSFASGSALAWEPKDDSRVRVLQQTVSQLRKSLDEVRQSRDALQEQYFTATTELETAQAELSVLEAQVRLQREFGKDRGTALGEVQANLQQRTGELTEARERVRKLERELTTLRAAVGHDQSLVDRLREGEETLRSTITGLEKQVADSKAALEDQGSELMAEIESREAELVAMTAQLTETQLESLKAQNAAVGARTLERSRVERKVASHRGFIDEVKDAFAVASTQIRRIVADPAGTSKMMLHPIPIFILLVTAGMPLGIVRMKFKHRRRRAERLRSAAASAAARASQQAQSRPMRSVAMPRRREVPMAPSPPPTQVYSAPAQQQDSGMSASLDAVLGDPLAPGAPAPPPSRDEDELLGDLKNIVQRGLE